MLNIHKPICDAIRPQPKLPVDEWLLKNVRIERGNIPGPFDVGNSPWIREPLMQIRNNDVRSIIAACSVQSAKTEMLNGAMLYTIAEEGGDMGTYLQTDDSAHRFLDKRFKLHIMACEPTRRLLLKGDRSIQKQTVDYVHMVQYVFGTANIHNCQSLPLRTVFGDECAYWEEGRMDEVEKRTTSFDMRNSKRMFISTPLDNEGEFYRKWMKGTRSEWHVRCPECGHGQKFVWRNMRWDGDEARLEDGTYDLQKIKASIRYECDNCKAPWYDNPIMRRRLSSSGYYVDENPNADPAVKSYHWNALTVDWVEWYVIVAEFLAAQNARKLGDFTPLAEWTRKRLGEFYSPQDALAEEINLGGGFLMEEAWDAEFRRYLTVDVQKGYFRVVVRLWAQNGASRLYFAGNFSTWEQIRDYQLLHSIADGRVLVDCGDRQQEVLSQCAKYGWFACKGDGSNFFTHYKPNPATGRIEGIKRPYSPPQKMDASQGMHTADKQKMLADPKRRGVVATRIMWSSDYIKFILIRLRAGHGAPWQIAANAPEFYIKEIGNEVLQRDENKKTGKTKMFLKRLGDNHSFDCEAMQVLAASIEKLLGDAPLPSEPKDAEAD